MKIFLDTANLDEIQQASDFGLLDGITTNPTLAAKEGRPFRELILKASEIVKDGVVNAEVVSTDTEGMLREGRELASWHSNIVVKVPMTPDGVRALHLLHGEGIRINVTLIRIPSPCSRWSARTPSGVIGTFTTMFECQLASSRPSRSIPSVSVDTTSAFTTPSFTISEALRISSRNGRPSLAARVGFVVMPSSRPKSDACWISSKLAVSRNIFMVISCKTDYSVVMLNGVVKTIGGRRKVTARLTANRNTAVSSRNAEIGKPLQAQTA